jgi:hypothetical protein
MDGMLFKIQINRSNQPGVSPAIFRVDYDIKSA